MPWAIHDSVLLFIYRSCHPETNFCNCQVCKAPTDFVVLQALMTAALVEWRAKLYTPARRLFEDAIREAPTCGALAMQFVAWTWADCELQQGRAAMATEVLNRALHTCKTPALILLLAKVGTFLGMLFDLLTSKPKLMMNKVTSPEEIV